MTSALIVYGLVVGVLMAATAHALEGILTVARRPVRWVWGAALGLMVVLTALALVRTTRPANDATGPFASAQSKVELAAASEPGMIRELLATLEARRYEIEHAAQAMIANVGSSLPTSVEQLVPYAWLAISALIIVIFGLVYLRVFRLHRRWPRAVVHGTPVRVAANTGPAVFGFGRPEIVIPRWLLDRSAIEQRLVLDHELEHVRARDPLLLAGACVAAAVMPWNPAVWWMLSRLRLAVELDCDSRVLRRGVAPRPYGELLIELAGIRSEITSGVAALAGRPSHLEQRLLAMKPQRSRRARVVALTFAGTLALASLVVACSVELPTSAEVAAMDVAATEAVAKKLPLFSKQAGEIVYTVDGVPVSATQAHAVAADQIATIDVVGSKIPGGKAEIRVMKIPQVQLTPATQELLKKKMVMADLLKAHARHAGKLGVTGAPGDKEAGDARFIMTKPGLQLYKVSTKPGEETKIVGATPTKPMFMLDGARATAADIHALRAADISGVEIIKGATATRLYGTPDAANGVINVTTKNQTTNK